MDHEALPLYKPCKDINHVFNASIWLQNLWRLKMVVGAGVSRLWVSPNYSYLRIENAESNVLIAVYLYACV